jgi:outer membrane biosynthesis protein TonB
MHALAMCSALSSVAFQQQATPHSPARVSLAQRTSLTRVTPVFPDEARRQGVNGLVLMREIIGTDGLVKDASVISWPLLLRANYLAAVRHWTFKPYLIDGVPTAAEVQISIDMQMRAN